MTVQTRSIRWSLGAILLILAGCSADPPAGTGGGDESDTGTTGLGDVGVSTLADTGRARGNGSVDGGIARDVSISGGTDARPYTTRPAPGIWRLGPDADSWKTFDEPGRASRHAPDGEVVAAFDIEHSAYAFVLTADSVHKLHVRPPEWESSRPLSEISDALSGADMLAAHSDPEESPDDAFAVFGLDQGIVKRWNGEYDFEQKSFTDVDSGEAVQWSSASSPNPAALVATWRDNDNSRDWLSGADACDRTEEFGPYVGYLTADRLHLRDAIYCTEYFTSSALDQSPIPASNRPSVGELGATFWHRGALYVVAAE